VPLTILEITDKHTIALIEMGDNHPGEVRFLCQIAQPNFGFVTNVGKDHLEGFGSFEKNIDAKKEIFDYLKEHSGTGFVDITDPIVSKMPGRNTSIVSYGAPTAYSFIEYKGANPLVEFIDENGELVQTHLFGAFNFDNLKLTYCIGKYFNVPNSDISQALREYIPTNNRSQVISTSRNTLIMDAYNANPSSVLEAVKSFAGMNTPKSKWVILGDMFELGAFADEEHLSLINFSMNQGFDEVIFVGETYSKVCPNSKISAFRSKSEAEVYIKKIAPEGAIILLKGSRGMQMETLKDIL
jgi:UDP-N-acetylmuramoyl-tripeptide--D-alanyl-D-alanine ligase